MSRGQEGYRRRIVRIEYEEIEGTPPPHQPTPSWSRRHSEPNATEPPREGAFHPSPDWPNSQPKRYTPAPQQVTYAEPKGASLENCCGVLAVAIFSLGGLYLWLESSSPSASPPPAAPAAVSSVAPIDSLSPLGTAKPTKPAPLNGASTPAPTSSQTTASPPPARTVYSLEDEEALRLLHRARAERDAHDLDAAAATLKTAIGYAQHPALLGRIVRELRDVERLR